MRSTIVFDDHCYGDSSIVFTLEHWMRMTGKNNDSISGEHESDIRWHHGDPMFKGPAVDGDMYAGGIARQIDAAHRDDERLRQYLRPFGFPCRFCGEGISFVDKKPFDRNGAHRCIAKKREQAHD